MLLRASLTSTLVFSLLACGGTTDLLGSQVAPESSLLQGLDEQLRQAIKKSGAKSIEAQQARVALATELFNQDRYRPALLLFNEAYGVYRNKYPDQLRSRVSVRVDLAKSYHRLNDEKKARKHYEGALEEWLAQTDPEPEYTIWLRGRIAAFCHATTDFMSAYEQYKVIHEFELKTHGADSLEAHGVAVSVGACAIELGRLDEAEKLLEAAAVVLANDKSGLRFVHLNLAVLYMFKKNYEKALPLLKKQMEGAPKVGEAGDDDFQLTRDNIAVALEALGDLDAAVLMMKEVVEVYERHKKRYPKELKEAKKTLEGLEKDLRKKNTDA